MKALKDLSAEVALVDTSSVGEVSKAFKGAACVVSAVQGLHDVIVDTQTVLLRPQSMRGCPGLSIGLLDGFHEEA